MDLEDADDICIDEKPVVEDERFEVEPREVLLLRAEMARLR